MSATRIFSGFIAGRPTPKGSFKAIWNAKAGRAFLKPDSRDSLSAWVANLRAAIPVPHNVTKEPVFVDATFYLGRPKKHYTKKGIRPDAPVWVSKRPDLDKLQRALLDALTGVVWHDDEQVVQIEARKCWCARESEPGCQLNITEVGQ